MYVICIASKCVYKVKESDYMGNKFDLIVFVIYYLLRIYLKIAPGLQVAYRVIVVQLQ